jgi:mono/diheme cytochrome c family protein
LRHDKPDRRHEAEPIDDKDELGGRRPPGAGGIGARGIDAARLAAGEAAWNKAACLQCHGSAGEGGTGGEFPAGPSLRTTQLNRVLLVDTIRCGRPGTQMPAWLDGAYTEISCYGLPKGPPPAGLDLTPVLSGDEVDALVDYMMAKMVGK